MLQLAVLAALFAAVGLIRPHWSSLLVALGSAALAFVWLLLHEDVPGDEIGAGDVFWYVAMSVLVGGAVAVACAAGVLAGGALRHRRDRAPR